MRCALACEGRRAGWRIGGFVWPEASRLGPRSAFGIGRMASARESVYISYTASMIDPTPPAQLLQY